MSRLWLVTIVLFSFTTVADAEDIYFTFNGSYFNAEGEEQAFGMLVPLDSIYALELGGGYQLHFETPETSDEFSTTQTLLLKKGRSLDGLSAYEISKTVSTTGSTSYERSYAFRQCSNGLKFATPASNILSNCKLTTP